MTSETESSTKKELATPQESLSDSQKIAILRFVATILGPPGLLLAVLTFFVGFLIKDVAVSSAINKVNAELNELERKIGNANDEIKKQTDSVTETVAKARKDANDQFRKQTDDVTETISKAKKDANDQLKKQTDETVEAIGKARKDAETKLSGQLLQLGTTLDNAKSRADSLDGKVGSLNGELEKHNSEIQRLDQLLADAKGKISLLGVDKAVESAARTLSQNRELQSVFAANVDKNLVQRLTRLESALSHDITGNGGWAIVDEVLGQGPVGAEPGFKACKELLNHLPSDLCKYARRNQFIRC